MRAKPLLTLEADRLMLRAVSAGRFDHQRDASVGPGLRRLDLVPRSARLNRSFTHHLCHKLRIRQVKGISWTRRVRITQGDSVQTLQSSAPAARRTAQAATAALTMAGSLGAIAQAQAQPTTASAYATDSAVAVIVKVPKPWYAPRFVVVGKMRETIPQYQALPGLAFKAFSFAQAGGQFGGIYLWKDLASARAWFAPAWFARVQQERGVAADVRFFEVLAAIDNTPGGTPADPESSSVTTLSTWPLPAGLDKSSLAQQFQSGLAADRGVPGLLRRYFVVTEQGRYGHISLWRHKDSARAASGGGKPGGAQSPDTDAVVEWFDTPILLPSVLPGNQPQVPGL